MIVKEIGYCLPIGLVLILTLVFIAKPAQGDIVSSVSSFLEQAENMNINKCNCSSLNKFTNGEIKWRGEQSGFDAVKDKCKIVGPSLKCVDKECGTGSEIAELTKGAGVGIGMLENFRPYCGNNICSYQNFIACLEVGVGTKNRCEAQKCMDAWLDKCKFSEIYTGMVNKLKQKINQDKVEITLSCEVERARARLLNAAPVQLSISPMSLVVSLTWLVVTVLGFKFMQ